MPIKVSVEKASGAICSFPCGSAGGPDGLRPNTSDMTSTSAEGDGPLLLGVLTTMANLVLEGKTLAPVHLSFLCVFSSPRQERWWRKTNCGWMVPLLSKC